MRRLPSLFSLRAFEVAARLESFTAAGVELCKTTSAISHQIKMLEAWVEQPLFLRQTRRVVLTPEGHRLYEKIKNAFDVIEDVCAELKPREQKGVLAVHSAPSFASKWLSPRLAEYMRANPTTTIRMSSSAEPIDLNKDTSIDVEIAYGSPVRTMGVCVEALGCELTVPMCSPRLLLNQPIEHPEDVLRFMLIESKLNPVRWADWCALNNIKLNGKPRSSFDRGALAIAAAVDGLGVVLESVRFAENELAKGDLMILDGPNFAQIEREIHFLCYRQQEAHRDEIIEFRDWLKMKTQSKVLDLSIA
jgi:LysR family glycine cleavage system transcriptional activator